jgi:hypothetical protein
MRDLCKRHSGEVFLPPDVVELIRQIEHVENLEQSNHSDASGALEEYVGGGLHVGALGQFRLGPPTPESRAEPKRRGRVFAGAAPSTERARRYGRRREIANGGYHPNLGSA